MDWGRECFRQVAVSLSRFETAPVAGCRGHRQASRIPESSISVEAGLPAKTRCTGSCDDIPAARGTRPAWSNPETNGLKPACSNSPPIRRSLAEPCLASLGSDVHIVILDERLPLPVGGSFRLIIFLRPAQWRRAAAATAQIARSGRANLLAVVFRQVAPPLRITSGKFQGLFVVDECDE